MGKRGVTLMQKQRVRRRRRDLDLQYLKGKILRNLLLAREIYFHCNEDGHWKRNYKIYLDLKRKENEIDNNNKQGKNNLLFIEACVAIDSTDTWIIDSGATHHVYKSIQGLRVTKKFIAKEFTLHLGDGSRVKASAMGDITLNLIILSIWF